MRTTLALFPEYPTSTLEERIQKNRETRTANTLARNEKIRERFNHLYNVERLRYDDVIATLCTDFCLSKATVERALKS